MPYDCIFGYARLSDDDEDKLNESNSIQNQKILIEQFVGKKKDFQKAKVQFFFDDGFTGMNYKRPGFENMMELARKTESSCIIVKDLSRLGRDTIETQNFVDIVFPFLGIRFISINDNYDSNAAYSDRKDTEIKFKNLINGIYPEICSKNIKQVRRKLDELGRFTGSIPPYGYQFNGDDKTSLLLDTEVAQVVRRIFDERLKGTTYANIARHLNEAEIAPPALYLTKKGYRLNYVVNQWMDYMVKKILMNPVYAGTMVNHKTECRVVSTKLCKTLPRDEWICVKGTHEAIVTEEELKSVAAMVRIKKKPMVKREKFIFSGKIRCGYCKKPMKVERAGKEPKVYCLFATQAKDVSCYRKMYPSQLLENLVLQLVREQAAMAKSTLDTVKKMNKTLDISRLKKEKENYEEQIKFGREKKMDCYEKYVDGKFDKEEFVEHKEKLRRIEAECEEKIKGLIMDIAEAESRRRKESSPSLLRFSHYADLEALSYPIVQELIDTIYFYDPEHIEVIWNYQDDFMSFLE
ncbi:recombinase family protein [Blautia hominis]|uniref:Recombinase family protein n=1 Tax=Blautia hominis TaxID=2025493 RepID=A0ABQ0BFN5_9FIRM